ncbi:hypothetical protein BDN67DRAFT_913810 [Paxillus ammoniavirescens]|nr:hypothetical protein BDN67DRAFT_913810 [Paxillus ammoniavirescens]
MFWGYNCTASGDGASYEKWPQSLHSNQSQHQAEVVRGDQRDHWNEDLHFLHAQQHPGGFWKGWWQSWQIQKQR